MMINTNEDLTLIRDIHQMIVQVIQMVMAKVGLDKSLWIAMRDQKVETIAITFGFGD